MLALLVPSEYKLYMKGYDTKLNVYSLRMVKIGSCGIAGLEVARKKIVSILLLGALVAYWR